MAAETGDARRGSKANMADLKKRILVYGESEVFRVQSWTEQEAGARWLQELGG